MIVVYLIGAVFVLIIAWNVLKIALGYLVPLEISALAYTKEQVSKYGNSKLIPDEFIVELSDLATVQAKSIAPTIKKNVRVELVENIDTFLNLLDDWINTDEKFQYGPDFLVELFIKHKIPRLHNNVKRDFHSIPFSKNCERPVQI